MNKSVLYGIVGFTFGILVSGLIFFAQKGPTTETIQPQPTPVIHETSHMMKDDSMTMDDMVESLKGKTGDEFDKQFISEMIVHHEGAIDMAKLAQEQAGHDEIKKLANDIITAQMKEITDMKNWQSAWNY